MFKKYSLHWSAQYGNGQTKELYHIFIHYQSFISHQSPRDDPSLYKYPYFRVKQELPNCTVCYSRETISLQAITCHWGCVLQISMYLGQDTESPYFVRVRPWLCHLTSGEIKTPLSSVPHCDTNFCHVSLIYWSKSNPINLYMSTWCRKPVLFSICIYGQRKIEISHTVVYNFGNISMSCKDNWPALSTVFFKTRGHLLVWAPPRLASSGLAWPCLAMPCHALSCLAWVWMWRFFVQYKKWDSYGGVVLMRF